MECVLNSLKANKKFHGLFPIIVNNVHNAIIAIQWLEEEFLIQLTAIKFLLLKINKAIKIPIIVESIVDVPKSLPISSGPLDLNCAPFLTIAQSIPNFPILSNLISKFCKRLNKPNSEGTSNLVKIAIHKNPCSLSNTATEVIKMLFLKINFF